MYRSTKTYGHDLGLSACFRQHKAESHCRFLHGYALSFHFVFEATHLDERGWVVDFGALGRLKSFLKDTFDHKMLVAGDDPLLEDILGLHDLKLADVLVLPAGVGCEAFARMGFAAAQSVVQSLEPQLELLRATDLSPSHQSHRVRVVSCEVREHGANSAIYYSGAY